MIMANTVTEKKLLDFLSNINEKVNYKAQIKPISTCIEMIGKCLAPSGLHVACDAILGHFIHLV